MVPRKGATFVAVAGWALTLNYVWELAQSPLYFGMDTLRESWWHCLVASMGDVLLVLLIVAAGWATFGEANWFARQGTAGVVFSAAVGVAVAVVVEWAALRAGRWSYTRHMPLIPALELGILPILQMALLPPVIFRLASRWNADTNGVTG